MPEEEVLTADQVAAEFSVTAQTVRNWIRGGALPAVKIGHVYRVTRSDVSAMIARHRGETAPLGEGRDVWLPETLGTPYRSAKETLKPSIWDGTNSPMRPRARN